MRTRHGFLAPYVAKDGTVKENAATLFIEGEETRHYKQGPRCCEYLIELAVRCEITHLWILPGYQYETSEEEARKIGTCPNPEYYDFTPYTPLHEEHVSSLSGRRLVPPSHEVAVIWLEKSSWGLPADVPSLQRTFHEIERRLGVPMKGHPGVMGLSYLRKVDEKNYWRYFNLPKDIAWPMIRSVSVSAISNFAPVTGDNLNKKFLYCYDRNSSQPYAASQIKAGIGQPQAFQDIPFDHLAPGFWCCELEGEEDIWQGLPLIPANREWLPTPLVKMAAQKGCRVRVYEAYIWPDKKDRAAVFQRWAHNLWDLREEYASGTAEREAVKSIMNKTIGLLRRKSAQDKEYRDYRPDWYSLILAEERAVVWLKAEQVFRELGVEPVGCYHDALYYCADEEISMLTTHKNGNSLKHSLGGYKIDWVLPMCDEVKEILSAPEPRNPADRIGLLKKWGREHGYI